MVFNIFLSNKRMLPIWVCPLNGFYSHCDSLSFIRFLSMQILPNLPGLKCRNVEYIYSMTAATPIQNTANDRHNMSRRFSIIQVCNLARRRTSTCILEDCLNHSSLGDGVSWIVNRKLHCDVLIQGIEHCCMKHELWWCHDQDINYWPFVRGIHQWPVDSPVTGGFLSQRASNTGLRCLLCS